MDETYIATSASKCKVVVYTGDAVRRHGVRHVPNYGEHVTLVTYIKADGGHLKPGLILPLKTLPPAAVDRLSFFDFAGSEKGWMNRKIFSLWVKNVAIPEAERCRTEKGKPNAPIIIFMDNHSSRENPEALEELRLHRIDVLTFPAHATHVLQPLDVSFFGAFKVYLRKNLDLSGAATLDKRRACMLAAVQKAWYFSCYPGTITGGFARSGIWPLCPARVLDGNDLVCSSDVPTTEAVVRKRIRIDGRLLTSTECISELRQATQPAQANPVSQPILQTQLTQGYATVPTASLLAAATPQT